MANPTENVLLLLTLYFKFLFLPGHVLSPQTCWKFSPPHPVKFATSNYICSLTCLTCPLTTFPINFSRTFTISDIFLISFIASHMSRAHARAHTHTKENEVWIFSLWLYSVSLWVAIEKKIDILVTIDLETTSNGRIEEVPVNLLNLTVLCWAT